MATSTIPAVLDALVGLLDAALTDVDVHDGPPISGDLPDYLCIGHDGGESPEAVEFTQEAAGIRRGSHPRNESYDVLCILMSATGDERDITTARDRAFELLAAVEDTLRPDPSLGLEQVQTAQLSGGTYLQEQQGSGFSAGIRFRISVRARI